MKIQIYRYRNEITCYKGYGKSLSAPLAKALTNGIKSGMTHKAIAEKISWFVENFGTPAKMVLEVYISLEMTDDQAMAFKLRFEEEELHRE